MQRFLLHPLSKSGQFWDLLYSYIIATQLDSQAKTSGTAKSAKDLQLPPNPLSGIVTMLVS